MCDDKIIVATHATPAGTLVLGVWHDTLCLCDWQVSRRHAGNLLRLRRALGAPWQEGDAGLLAAARQQIDEYFAGIRQVFSLPIGFSGSEFQNKVWETLQSIPYGNTLSYASLAQKVGRPAAVRAVANAVGANPISILVPCHRIIGSNGSLTGYAGGLSAKRLLLQLEGLLPSRP